MLAELVVNSALVTQPQAYINITLMNINMNMNMILIMEVHIHQLCSHRLV